MLCGTFCSRFSTVAHCAGATAHRGGERVGASQPSPPAGRAGRPQTRVFPRAAATGLSALTPLSPSARSSSPAGAPAASGLVLKHREKEYSPSCGAIRIRSAYGSQCAANRPAFRRVKMLRNSTKELKTQFKGTHVKIINILVIAFYSA